MIADYNHKKATIVNFGADGDNNYIQFQIIHVWKYSRPPIQIRNLCTKNHVFMINKITHVDMLKLFNSHRKLLIAQSPCDRKKNSRNQEFKFSRVRSFPGWPTGFQFSITGCYDLVIYFTGNSTHLLKQRLFSVKYLDLDVLKTIKYKYWIKSW